MPRLPSDTTALALVLKPEQRKRIDQEAEVRMMSRSAVFRQLLDRAWALKDRRLQTREA